jgi:hypothetical protein
MLPREEADGYVAALLALASRPKPGVERRARFDKPR